MTKVLLSALLVFSGASASMQDVVEVRRPVFVRLSKKVNLAECAKTLSDSSGEYSFPGCVVESNKQLYHDGLRPPSGSVDVTSKDGSISCRLSYQFLDQSHIQLKYSQCSENKKEIIYYHPSDLAKVRELFTTLREANLIYEYELLVPGDRKNLPPLRKIVKSKATR